MTTNQTWQPPLDNQKDEKMNCENCEKYREMTISLLESRVNPPLIVKEIGGLDAKIKSLISRRGRINKSDLKKALKDWEDSAALDNRQHDGVE